MSNISFNYNDYHLRKIENNSKLFNLDTKYSYRIYGLKNKSNPDIYIEYGKFLNLNTECIEKFFKLNGISIEIALFQDKDDKRGIYIGLRYDLREHVTFCSCVLQTIIYYLEGRLNLNTDYKIIGIPKFNINKV